jgi:hypothetical protein
MAEAKKRNLRLNMGIDYLDGNLSQELLFEHSISIFKITIKLDWMIHRKIGTESKKLSSNRRRRERLDQRPG